MNTAHDPWQVVRDMLNACYKIDSFWSLHDYHGLHEMHGQLLRRTWTRMCLEHLYLTTDGVFDYQ